MTFDEAMQRGKTRWGSEFVEPVTTPEQRYHFNGARVEITTTYANGEQFIRRGRIGITTGWAPALLLVSRRGEIGSYDVLNENDIITRVIAP